MPYSCPPLKKRVLMWPCLLQVHAVCFASYGQKYWLLMGGIRLMCSFVVPCRTRGTGWGARSISIHGHASWSFLERVLSIITIYLLLLKIITLLKMILRYHSVPARYYFWHIYPNLNFLQSETQEDIGRAHLDIIKPYQDYRKQCPCHCSCSQFICQKWKFPISMELICSLSILGKSVFSNALHSGCLISPPPPINDSSESEKWDGDWAAGSCTTDEDKTGANWPRGNPALFSDRYVWTYQ